LSSAGGKIIVITRQEDHPVHRLAPRLV